MIQFTYLPDAYWLIGGAVLVAVLLFGIYCAARGRAKWRQRVWLIGLRWLTIAAVILCLLDPQWIAPIRHQQKARVAVLLDTSRSMGIKDVPGGRLAFAKEWLQQKFSAAVPPEVAVSYYSFDQTLAPLASLDSITPTGSVTALADALEGLLSVHSDDPLTGVVLCSDGIENVTRQPEAVARLFRQKGIPIHVVCAGTTNDVRDILIENVQVKRAVPNKAPTRIAITLRSSGFSNQRVPIEVRNDQKVVALKEVKLTGGTQKVEMDFTPQMKGFQVYEVNVPGQPGEWLANNNRRAFGLEVVDPTMRVIYMEGTPQQPEGPMPEWKYLKDALESDPNIKVKVLYRLTGARGHSLNKVDADPETGQKVYPVEHSTRGFPRTLAELLKYDVVIHSDIRKESFTPEQLRNIARLVEEFGGGFVMIGGNSAFGKGGYHKTILDRIIPVAMEQASDSQAQPFRLQVPPSALSHPIMALGSNREETQNIWTKKLPYLYGLNLVDRAKPGATVLAVDPAARNEYGSALVLAAQEIGKGRSLAFTSDTTRTWGRDFETKWGEPINPSLPLTESNCDSRYYRQFWVNAIRWLASGRMSRTNSPVTLELAQSYGYPNETIAASVTVRDKDMTEVANADVALIVAASGKTNSVVKAAYDSATRSYVANISPSLPGAFTVTARANVKGEKVGEDKQLLMCEEVDREMADVRANPKLMSNLARLSGGKMISTTENNSASIASVFGNVPPATVEYRHTPLWNRAWWLATIVGLLTVEWVMRRIVGMA